jgi:hypothetical protein
MNCDLAIKSRFLTLDYNLQSLRLLTAYENFDRRLSLVYLTGAVLATGTRTDIFTSADLVVPSSLSDCWIYP